MSDTWMRIDGKKPKPVGAVRFGSVCMVPDLFGVIKFVVVGRDDGEVLVITESGGVRRVDMELGVVVSKDPPEGFAEMTGRIKAMESELRSAAWGDSE